LSLEDLLKGVSRQQALSDLLKLSTIGGLEAGPGCVGQVAKLAGQLALKRPALAFEEALNDALLEPLLPAFLPVPFRDGHE
jgi:hypothetical protein